MESDFVRVSSSIGTILVPAQELTGEVEDDLENIFRHGNSEGGVEQPRLSRSLSVGDTVKHPLTGKDYLVCGAWWEEIK